MQKMHQMYNTRLQTPCARAVEHVSNHSTIQTPIVFCTLKSSSIKFECFVIQELPDHRRASKRARVDGPIPFPVKHMLARDSVPQNDIVSIAASFPILDGISRCTRDARLKFILRVLRVLCTKFKSKSKQSQAYHG